MTVPNTRVNEVQTTAEDGLVTTITVVWGTGAPTVDDLPGDVAVALREWVDLAEVDDRLRVAWDTIAMLLLAHGATSGDVAAQTVTVHVPAIIRRDVPDRPGSRIVARGDSDGSFYVDLYLGPL